MSPPLRTSRGGTRSATGHTGGLGSGAVAARYAWPVALVDGPAAIVLGRRRERTRREGTVLLYEDASHAVNGEQPDQIAADLESFLNEHTC